MTTPARRPMYSFGTGTAASRVDIRIADNLSYDEWRDVLAKVVGIADASAWWIGDVLAYGEWKYGEKYRAILDELEVAYDRIRDYAYVSGNVPATIRRDDLSWMHHRVVAKLVPSEQEIWLARAADEGWSYRELRDAIAEENQLPAASDHVILEQFRITLDPERLSRWKAGADRAHSPLSDWVIAIVDVAVEGS